MMTLMKLVVAAAVGVSIVSASTVAPVNPIRAAVSPNCIEIYSQPDFTGDKAEICSTSTPTLPTVNSLGSTFNFYNKISSVRGGANVEWISLFPEVNFAGTGVGILYFATNLIWYGFNDRASSIHYSWLSLPNGTDTPSQGCIFVFEHPDYQGRVTELCQDTAHVGRRDFDDQISSVKLGPGVDRARLYTDLNFAGNSFDVLNDWSQLDSVHFNNLTSSIRIFQKLSGVFCEGSSGDLTCPPGTTIDVRNANYGRTTGNTTCPHVAIANTHCVNPTHTARLRNQCNGLQTCAVTATNAVWGDTCADTYKYLEASYTCVA